MELLISLAIVGGCILAGWAIFKLIVAVNTHFYVKRMQEERFAKYEKIAKNYNKALGLKD